METRNRNRPANTLPPNNPVKNPKVKGKKHEAASTKTPAPETKTSVEVGTEMEPIAESIKESLNAKTKEELIDELVKLIDDENKTDAGTCNSDKIKNQLWLQL